MPTENTARAQEPPSDAPHEGDYQTLYSALAASARGRAFLAEHARRSASPDAEAMSATLGRLRKLTAAIDKLAGLIDLVERQITDMVAPGQTVPASQGGLPDLSARPLDQAERTHLAVVPPPEQPELPIPSPATTQPPPIALVRSDKMMAEITFVETQAASPPQAAAAAPAQATPAPAPAKSAPPPADPLGSIMALSEEERLALFS